MTQTENTLKPKEWVKNYSDTLYRFAVLRVNDEETSRDLVQETFLAALRNLENFRGEISEKNRLFAILKNKIIDHYRKKASTLISEIDQLMESASEYFDEEDHWKKSAYPGNWNTDYSSPRALFMFPNHPI
ncbi:MAG: sigma-70 family RNA polymerase sigma factor [Bacteroidota bacterium]